MKIILCSANSQIRERWFTILADHGHSLYQASSLPVLETLIHRRELYLLLMQQQFADLQTIATLCRTPDVLKVFFLSDAPSPTEGLALLQRGAVGYANTYIAPARLVEAINTVASGRVWFEQEIISRVIDQLNRANIKEGTPGSPMLDQLTAREREIALLVAEGLSNQAIGERLFISERTVKAHLGSIFRKTGTGSRLGLAMKIQRGA